MVLAAGRLAVFMEACVSNCGKNPLVGHANPQENSDLSNVDLTRAAVLDHHKEQEYMEPSITWF